MRWKPNFLPKQAERVGRVEDPAPSGRTHSEAGQLSHEPAWPCAGWLAMAVLELAMQGFAVFGFILFFVLWLMHFMSIIYV